MIELTEHQKKASASINEFLAGPGQVFRLSGYAGTGKTECITQVVDPSKTTFTAPTAKAAQVLNSKGISAQTLHSLIYTPYEYEHPETGKPTLGFQVNESSSLKNGGTVVVDEASMVSSHMAEDLLSFPVKVIAVGDPAQLPPIRSKGNKSLLTGTSDITLTEVQRAALDSPVTALATYVRKHGMLPPWNGSKHGTRIVARLADAGDLGAYDQVIVGRHKTRFALINKMRHNLGIDINDPVPKIGERVISKANVRELGMVNGEQFIVQKAQRYGDVVHMTVANIDRSVDCVAWIHGFNGPEGKNELEHMKLEDKNENVEMWSAYAITAHSSQGSEWNHVAVVDESRVFKNSSAQWIYTAVTRAQKSVTVVRGR